MEKTLVGEHKARKGLVRVKLVVSDNTIVHVELTGDFIIHPEEALWCIEDKMKGNNLDEKDILDALHKAFDDCEAVPVGFTYQDVYKAIINALSEG